MILTPLLALSSLRSPHLTSPPAPPSPWPTLCYDTRYARHFPHPRDCAFILNRLIVPPGTTSSPPLNFSRYPFFPAGEHQVPFTWSHGGCAVVIDIPDTPQHPVWREESSLMEVKSAAFQLLVRCVVNGEHLGGVALLGRRLSLQVRVEAREDGEG